MILTEISTGLWELTGPLCIHGLRIGHRMTIMRLKNGRLVLHSPVKLTPEIRRSIEELGEVGYVVAPSLFHDMWLEPYFDAYPDAVFGCALGVQLERPELPFREILTNSDNFVGNEEIRYMIMRGMPKVNELVFLHEPSGTLIVCDLVFNLQQTYGWWDRTAKKFLGIHDKFAVSRLFRGMIKDPEAFRRSLERVLQWDFDRLVMGHGRIVQRGAKDRLRMAYAFLNK